MTSISQLQLTYNPEEDRILFRLNTNANEEFRFWITRRYSMLLAKALSDHRAKDPDISTQPDVVAKQAIQEFKREEAIAKGDFGKKFEPREVFPLGAEPVLAFKLTYRVEGDKLHLSVQPKEGHGINVVVDSQLNFSLSKLLQSAANSGGWGLKWEDESNSIPQDRVVN